MVFLQNVLVQLCLCLPLWTAHTALEVVRSEKVFLEGFLRVCLLFFVGGHALASCGVQTYGTASATQHKGHFIRPRILMGGKKTLGLPQRWAPIQRVWVLVLNSKNPYIISHGHH